MPAKAGHPVTPAVQADRSRASNGGQWLLDRSLSRAMTRKLKHLLPGVSLDEGWPRAQRLQPPARSGARRSAHPEPASMEGSLTLERAMGPGRRAHFLRRPRDVAISTGILNFCSERRRVARQKSCHPTKVYEFAILKSHNLRHLVDHFRCPVVSAQLVVRININ